jgi:hypothetical protein
MKKRIKEIKDSRGSSKYYPQWKFIWWHYYTDCHDDATYFYSLSEAMEWINYDSEQEVKYHNID